MTGSSVKSAQNLHKEKAQDHYREENQVMLSRFYGHNRNQFVHQVMPSYISALKGKWVNASQSDKPCHVCIVFVCVCRVNGFQGNEDL